MRRRYRAAHPPEFRRQMVGLYRTGRSLRDLAKQFEPSLDTIADWVRQADADARRRPDVPITADREELTRLRRENHRLRQERDILAKAAAWFARDKTLSGSSSS